MSTAQSIRSFVLTVWGVATIHAIASLSRLATSVILANAGAQRSSHDTYYVVGSQTPYLVLIGAFAVFTLWYAWWPRWSRTRAQPYLAVLHTLLVVAGSLFVVFPNAFIGIARLMPRRYLDYPDAFATFSLISSIGHYAVFAGLLAFSAQLILPLFRRRARPA